MDVQRIEEIIEVLEQSTAREIVVRKGVFSVSAKKGEKVILAPTPRPSTVDTGGVTTESVESPQYVLAPMVGLFHFAEGINEGSLVQRGQTVGAIESMKLLNDVKSEISGKVVEVLVENEMPVEYGQPLLRLEPEECINGT